MLDQEEILWDKCMSANKHQNGKHLEIPVLLAFLTKLIELKAVFTDYFLHNQLFFFTYFIFFLIIYYHQVVLEKLA